MRVHLNLPLAAFDTIHEVAHTPGRNRSVKVNKDTLRLLLKDHVKAVGTLMDLPGIDVIDPPSKGVAS